MNFRIDNVSLIIFSDIDGTFMNNDSFDLGNNIEIVKLLEKSNHMFVFNTSKTFNEICHLQKVHRTNFSFICETGGGIYSNENISSPFKGKRKNYYIVHESPRIKDIKQEIQTHAKRYFPGELIFYDDMNKKQISDISGLKGEDLKRSLKRDFSILFRWKSTITRYEEFKSLLKNYNLNIIEGGRFSHICSNQNKGKAVQNFMSIIKNKYKNVQLLSIALGDSINDIDMLEIADFPCIVKSPHNKPLIDGLMHKNTIMSHNFAPNGWIECIQSVITKLRIMDNCNG